MMKNIFLMFLCFIFTGTAQASTDTKTLEMFCYDQQYIQFPPDSPKPGSWSTGRGILKTVTLTKDPKYPNEAYPRTVWTGSYNGKLNGAEVFVNIDARELNGAVEFLNTISIAMDGISAESTGGSYIRAALKMDSKSVGVICNEMKFQ